MSELIRDLRHSLRLLRRAPGFSFVAILVLALGIGVNTAIFSIVDVLLLQPRPGRIDSLVAVFNRDRTNQSDYRGFSYPSYAELRDSSGVFDGLLAQSFTTVGVREGELTRQAFAAVVSSNYFETLGVTLAAGRVFTAAEEQHVGPVPVAIASYGLWRRRGLDPAFIGSTVRINGSPVTIVGVAPKGFGGVMAFVSPQWWLPLGAYDTLVNPMFKERATGLADRGNYALNLAGALKPGVAAVAADGRLDAFAKQLGDAHPATDRDRTFHVGSLPRMAVSTRPQSDGLLAGLSALLMGMSALVLTVACLNLASLLLARGVARGREIAIRQALGGSRRRIVQQLLVEGFTLSVIGALVGLMAGWWTTIAMSAWLDSLLTFGIELLAAPSFRLVVAAALFAVVSTILFGLGPAWSLSRRDVNSELKGVPGGGRRRFSAGTLLVSAQLAVTVALVAAGGLFVRAAINAAGMDGGFAVTRQIVIALDPSLAGYDQMRTRAVYAAVLDRLRQTPGVESVSFSSTVAFGDITMSGLVRGAAPDLEVDATYDVIGSAYFRTLDLSMLRGREFTELEERSPAAVRPAIVDASLARRLFGEADPLGRTVSLRIRRAETPEAFTIVGIAPPLRHDLFEDPPRPHIYVPYGSRFNTMMTLHVRTASGVAEAALLPTIRRELQAVDDQLPVLSARTMTMHRDASIAAWSVRAAASLFSTFGVLALLLATIGVYGLKAYDMSRRTREIGIRIALGATGRDVLRLMLGEGARATAIAVGAGVLLAAGLGKLASGFLYRVSPIDPVVLGGAVLVLATAVMIATYVPARRATRVAPLDALRTE